MKHLSLIVLVVLVAGCARLGIGQRGTDAPAGATPSASAPAPRPSTSARTVDEFDTTSAEDRAAAVAMAEAKPAGEQKLGTTIASLGNPSEPGFWMETPLVKETTQGRVEYAGSGKSVAVELRPIEGEAGAGSRMSLAAMRLIEAPLTGLPEVLVFKM